MAGFLNTQLFGGSSASKERAEKRQRRQRAMNMARRGGLQGLVERFDPLKKDQLGLERQQQQKLVRDQYFRDKQRKHVEERRAEEQLKRQMHRKKEEIANYYRVGELRKTDARWESASLKAQRKYGRYEQKVQQKHHRQWLQTFRRMRMQRDRQYRQITKNIKKDIRRSRGLPDKMQGPWNI